MTSISPYIHSKLSRFKQIVSNNSMGMIVTCLSYITPTVVYSQDESILDRYNELADRFSVGEDTIKRYDSIIRGCQSDLNLDDLITKIYYSYRMGVSNEPIIDYIKGKVSLNLYYNPSYLRCIERETWKKIPVVHFIMYHELAHLLFYHAYTRRCSALNKELKADLFATKMLLKNDKIHPKLLDSLLVNMRRVFSSKCSEPLQEDIIKSRLSTIGVAYVPRDSHVINDSINKFIKREIGVSLTYLDSIVSYGFISEDTITHASFKKEDIFIVFNSYYYKDSNNNLINLSTQKIDGTALYDSKTRNTYYMISDVQYVLKNPYIVKEVAGVEFKVGGIYLPKGRNRKK